MKVTILLFTAGLACGNSVGLAATNAPAPPPLSLGGYFAKKNYVPRPLPKFAEMRSQLPAPIDDGKPEWIAMYWKAWELAFKNFHEPGPQSGFVSQFIDAAFNQNIFLWDTCFMTLFCNPAAPLVPGIASLDNFYARQHEDGEICREINRATGVDFSAWVNQEGKPLFSRWGWVPGQPNAPVIYRARSIPEPAPRLTLDALNHPILAWAELESYRVTGDTQRVALVYAPLVRYYRALEKYGYRNLARDIALNHLDMMSRVFKQTGTLWENYAPDEAKPGRPAKDDFVGWSGLGPILYLLEFAIGLKPDAPKNELVWELKSAARQGCERYRFNGHVVSLVAQPAMAGAPKSTLTINSDGAFTLRLWRNGQWQRFPVRVGEQTLAY